MRPTEGIPSLLSVDQAREMVLLIVRCSEVSKGEDKAQQDRERALPPSAGKMAKRSRFDATPSPHSIPAHSPIPRLNGRTKGNGRTVA